MIRLHREIKNFTLVARPDVPHRPQVSTQHEIKWLRKMIEDELKEMENADAGDSYLHLIKNQADAGVDIIIYICDFFAQRGVNLDDLIQAAHNANMDKVNPDGTVSIVQDGPRKGKIMKPEGWQGPDADQLKEIEYQEALGTWYSDLPQIDRSKVYYLASPYSHENDAVRNERYLHAVNACAELALKGLTIYSPIVHWHNVAMEHSLPTDAAYWKEVNFSHVETSREVIVLDISGVEESVGVKGEMRYANLLGIPISFYKPGDKDTRFEPERIERMIS